MPWRLVFTRSGEKDLSGLPSKDREAVDRALARLIDEPGAVDLKKLAGQEGRWRIRVGRWRVILKLDNAVGIISVLNVLPRARAYRD